MQASTFTGARLAVAPKAARTHVRVAAVARKAGPYDAELIATAVRRARLCACAPVRPPVRGARRWLTRGPRRARGAQKNMTSPGRGILAIDDGRPGGSRTRGAELRAGPGRKKARIESHLPEELHVLLGTAHI